MYIYIITQITLTLHIQTGTTTPAILTSLLPVLVCCLAGSFLPTWSLCYCQSTQARLAIPKLSQLHVNFVDIAAEFTILSSCYCTTHWETWTPVFSVLVRNCLSHIAIQKAGDQHQPSCSFAWNYRVEVAKSQVNGHDWNLLWHKPLIYVHILHNNVQGNCLVTSPAAI